MEIKEDNGKIVLTMDNREDLVFLLGCMYSTAPEIMESHILDFIPTKPQSRTNLLIWLKSHQLKLQQFLAPTNEYLGYYK